MYKVFTPILVKSNIPSSIILCHDDYLQHDSECGKFFVKDYISYRNIFLIDNKNTPAVNSHCLCLSELDYPDEFIIIRKKTDTCKSCKKIFAATLDTKNILKLSDKSIKILINYYNNYNAFPAVVKVLSNEIYNKYIDIIL